MIREAIEVANQKLTDEASDATLPAHRNVLISLIDEDQGPFFFEVRGTFVEDADQVTLRSAMELVPRSDIEAFVRSPMFAYIVQRDTGSFARVDGSPPVIRVARSIEPENLLTTLRHSLESCRDEAAKSSEDRRLAGHIETDVRRRFLGAL